MRARLRSPKPLASERTTASWKPSGECDGNCWAGELPRDGGLRPAPRRRNSDFAALFVIHVVHVVVVRNFTRQSDLADGCIFVVEVVVILNLSN